MAIHSNQNWSLIDPVTEANIQDGDIIDSCNLAQNTPNTVIMSGIENLHFTARCNLMNVEIDSSWTFDNGHQLSQVDLCYWLNSDFDEDGNLIRNPMNLPVEEENCRHVERIDEYIIDGETEYIYIRKDIVL